MSQDNATIYNAITGTQVTANIQWFLSVEDFRRFVSQQLMIPVEQCFILLPYGSKLKNGTFMECRRGSTQPEFYVFDRRLFSFPLESDENGLDPSDLEGLLESVTKQNRVTLIKPVPSPLLEASNVNHDLTQRKATSLLTTNMGWLSALEIDAHYFHSLIQKTINEIQNIFQCFNICAQYLKLYCYDIEKLYDSNVEFLNQLNKDSSSTRWEKVYEGLLQKLNTVNGEQEKRLSDFLDKRELEREHDKLLKANRVVSARLRQLKDQIDSNYNKRRTISAAFSGLKSRYEEPASKYEMENHMIKKFKEMTAALKDSTHDILERASDDFTDEYLVEVSSIISENKNSTIPNLFTIAQSLYIQAEESLGKKRQVQDQIIGLLSQTAFVQLQILEVKKVLLRECNDQLESLQESELFLSQVEDFPILYGLNLIEQLRRKSWGSKLQALDYKVCQEFQIIGDAEEKYRQKWNETFRQFAKFFNLSDQDLVEYRALYSSNPGKFKFSSTNEIKAENIERYLIQLSQHEVAPESLALLQKNLDNANNVPVLLMQALRLKAPGGTDVTSKDAEAIKGYQSRIRKLESLLHDAKFSNISSWPSGIMNNKSLNAFENNVPPINLKMSLLLADGREERSITANEEVISEVQKLKYELEQQKLELASSREECKQLRSRVVDFEDERNAYQETLVNLNQELSRLTAEREQQMLAKNDSFSTLKAEMNTIGKLNSSLLNELDEWKDKHEKLDKLKDGLLANMAKFENDFVKERSSLQNEIDELQREVLSLKAANDELVNNQMALASLKKEETPEITNNEAEQLSQGMTSRMFEIFASDIYILENIGLLLSWGDESQFQITRVKGLRRGVTSSDLDESVTDPKMPTIIKSPVFQAVKSAWESSESCKSLSMQKELLASMNKLFENGLYESSVIKRFKDIEALAKKLTKENKFKRGLIDNYQREKITIKNFQVGDMALFLPTRDLPDSISSSASSLASSFSSVDLSTPPPPGSFGPEKNHVKSKKDHNSNDKSRPWAAFTAFDESTRYFLRDNERFTMDRDWFIGRITSVERNLTVDSTSNSFKLPRGTSWVQVTAEFVTAKNF